MLPLTRLIFLTHPLAYHQLASVPWARPWIRREREIIPQWLDAMAALPPDAAVAIVSCHPRGPAAMEDFSARAEAVLGKRCFTLREPDWLQPEFWKRTAGATAPKLLADLQAACVTQGESWNKEELTTLFHARVCSVALLKSMRKRRMTIDPATINCEGWGEEFEGCTLKYCLAFQRALGLAKPVELEFDRCVPGAKFVLNPRSVERIALSPALRLFLFDTARGPIALFVSTQNTAADAAEYVRLPLELKRATIRGKQNLSLWPRPTIARRNVAPLGLHEPEQPLVRADAEGLLVPVCTGVIYRLAKAPAYIFAPRGMAMKKFRDLLMQATSVK